MDFFFICSRFTWFLKSTFKHFYMILYIKKKYLLAFNLSIVLKRTPSYKILDLPLQLTVFFRMQRLREGGKVYYKRVSWRKIYFFLKLVPCMVYFNQLWYLKRYKMVPYISIMDITNFSHGPIKNINFSKCPKVHQEWSH